MGRRDRRGTRQGGAPRGRGRRRPQFAAASGPTESDVLRVLSRRGRPLLAEPAILRALNLAPGAAQPLRTLLRGLVQAGRLELVKRRFRVPRRDGLLEGRYEPAAGGGERGGRVRGDGGEVWRVARSAGAKPGDRVLLQSIGDPASGRGEILDVLAGERTDWVGIFRRRGRNCVVVPYRDDAEWTVSIAPSESAGARDGDVVAVRRIASPQRHRRRATRRRGSTSAPSSLEGRISEILGLPGDPSADFRAIVWRRRLPLTFPEAVRVAAEDLDAEIPEAEYTRRVDLRDRSFFTIDPASARDHDDAICVEAAEGGASRLWVAIADVGHYVPEGSAIDREARRRGNSIYFPDRAIPMLPERLSGDLCSLRDGVDRLVVAVEFSLDASGKITRRSFHPAVIRSRARLTYAAAARVMQGGKDVGVSSAVGDQLRDLARVTQGLRRRRLAAGAIDLDLPEAEIEFGADGRVVEVRASERTEAHRAVEEAMLAANRAVAEALVAASRPAIHRNHPPPQPRALEALRELFERFGLHDSAPRRTGAEPRSDASPAEPDSPGWIARALLRAVGRPEERLVHQTTLRSMSQARYGADPLGHFALAFEHYAHFTSPIRRYADLVVHRALIEWMDGAPAQSEMKDPERQQENMQRIANRVSWRERVAVEAGREAVDLQKCALLQGRVGNLFDATLSGVAPFGLWLTLDEHFVEGLVHVSSLSEYVEFDERSYSFTAKRSGERYALGDRFEICVESVDIIQARIDFRLVRRLPAADHSADSKRSRSRSSL